MLRCFAQRDWMCLSAFKGACAGRQRVLAGRRNEDSRKAGSTSCIPARRTVKNGTAQRYRPQSQEILKSRGCTYENHCRRVWRGQRPLEIIKGCAEATSELDIDIMLTGDEKEIRRVAQENQISLNRIEIADAPDVITMEDSAGDIMKSKNNSSMALGLKKLAAGEGDAFLSAGNSGALVVGATMIVKRIKGVKRVAFAPVMPKDKGFLC